MIDKEETNIGVHAILVTDDLRVILQQREVKPRLINSGLTSLFGGTLKFRETLREALVREIKEELEIDISKREIENLGIYKKTQQHDGVDWQVNVFIVKYINPKELILHEGKSIYCVDPNIALNNGKLTRITRLAIKDYLQLKSK